MKVCFSYVHPPVPLQAHWTAHFDGLEEHGPYGMGSTKKEALDDLLDSTPVDNLTKWFDIETREVDTFRGPEYGHWIAYNDSMSVAAPWRETAVADLVAKIVDFA
jgi:hypothetical protein